MKDSSLDALTCCCEILLVCILRVLIGEVVRYRLLGISSWYKGDVLGELACHESGVWRHACLGACLLSGHHYIPTWLINILKVLPRFEVGKIK